MSAHVERVLVEAHRRARTDITPSPGVPTESDWAKVDGYEMGFIEGRTVSRHRVHAAAAPCSMSIYQAREYVRALGLILEDD